MTPQPQLYREPFRITVFRTGMIAIIGGAILAQFRGGLSRWPLDALLVLWPSFGGHWVEVFFLDYVRPRLSPALSLRFAARFAVWFVGGVGLGLGMLLTARVAGNFRRTPPPRWWLWGLAFIGIELVAHLILQLRGRPSFYDGRG